MTQQSGNRSFQCRREPKKLGKGRRHVWHPGRGRAGFIRPLRVCWAGFGLRQEPLCQQCNATGVWLCSAVPPLRAVPEGLRERLAKGVVWKFRFFPFQVAHGAISSALCIGDTQSRARRAPWLAPGCHRGQDLAPLHHAGNKSTVQTELQTLIPPS